MIDASSELASEDRYVYRDFQQSHEIKARFSLIANTTPNSFLVNRKQPLGNTFIERCLVVYHSLTDEEMSEANLNRDQRAAMKIKKFKASVREQDVRVMRQDLVRFDEYAKCWRFLGRRTTMIQTTAKTDSATLFELLSA